MMSNLKKVETSQGYNSELNEISEIEGNSVYLKVNLVGRRTYGEYSGEPNNGFAVDLGREITNLNLDKIDVYIVEENQSGKEVYLSEFKDGDIIAIYTSSSCCVLDAGYYQGTVIERKGELVVVFNDIGIVMKNENVGAPGFRSLENIESNSDWTKLLHREGE